MARPSFHEVKPYERRYFRRPGSRRWNQRTLSPLSPEAPGSGAGRPRGALLYRPRPGQFAWRRPRHAKRLRRTRIRAPDAMGARGRMATDRKSRRQTARVFQPRNLHRNPLRASRPLHQRGAASRRGRGAHLCGRGAGALPPIHVRKRRKRPAGQNGRFRLGQRSRRLTRRPCPRETG